MAPKEVIIDGVRYAPVVEVAKTSCADLRRALVQSYWGEYFPRTPEQIDEDAPTLRVWVTDDEEYGGEHPTIDEFVALFLAETK